MLLEVSIQNFAIIERTKINFSRGLNILTGETGTGKSIIIDAMNLILGGRADRSYIKDGADKSIVEALFYVPDENSIKDILDRYGIELESDNNILITRELYPNGRSIARVNGRIATLNMLLDLTSKLMNIQGQHENQILLSTDKHIDLVDALGEKELHSLKDIFKKKYLDLLNLKNELKKLSQSDMDRERKIDLLKFQIEEIEDSKFKVGDEEILVRDHKLLTNFQDVSTIVNGVYDQLSNSSYNAVSVIDQLRSISSTLNRGCKYDDEFKSYEENINGIIYSLEDISKSIRDYKNNDIDFSFENLSYVEERLSLLNSLKRKYGNSIDEILIYKNSIEDELNDLINSKDKLQKIKQDLKNIEDELNKYSKKLSNIRKKISLDLEKSIVDELKSLNMDKVIFKVKIDYLEYFNNNGKDKVEFYISTNPGQQLRPLSKVASGGEMSRVMLAFKNVLAKMDNIYTLVFDEIDTGISGITAQLVGKKIHEISKRYQVICITHLPQIAAMADSHFLIDKKFSNNETISTIKKLNYEEQVYEISRLIGGASITETTKRHAEEMLLPFKNSYPNIYTIG